MGSSQIYQNFIALNKWAHPLQPDAIISFSGYNEMAVPWDTKGDADELALYEGGLLRVLRYSESPRWLKSLAGWFPGIVRRTVFGSLVRLMYLDNYREDWRAEYLLSRIDPNYRPMPQDELQRRYKAAIASLSVDDIVDSVSVPLYVHSLEPISRDFPDIPIFAVFQPIEHPLEHSYARMTGVIPSIVNNEDRYTKIQFFNFQDVWKRNNLGPGSFVDGIHLSDKGHELVTEYLSEDLFPFVQNRCSTLLSLKAGAPPPLKQ